VDAVFDRDSIIKHSRGVLREAATHAA